jgi:hypothetical protein
MPCPIYRTVFIMRNLVLLLWSVLSCIGVLAFQHATGHGIELIYVVVGITLGPILLIVWSLDALRQKMGWLRW